MDKPSNFDEALRAMEEAGVEPILTQQSNHPALARELAAQLVSQMTLKEKAHMLGGHWNPIPGVFRGRLYNWEAISGGGCERLGIPPILFSDGPRGVVMKHSTAFPTPNIRAAAFDEELEGEIGEAIARECVAQGANFFAGVCMNLLRHPAWGRAQEAYGEDQFLTGRYGAALTRGVQKYGVIACPKHYALNSVENLRFSVNAKADEETLRDVYLYHFQNAVDAGAGSVMGAYNKVNGRYCCENKELLTAQLREKQGFGGFTISDFIWGVHDSAGSLEAGLDIEMPFTLVRRDLVKKVRQGKIAEEQLDAACVNVVATLLRFQNIYRGQSFGAESVCAEAHTALARRALEEGAVLLENDGMLPLDPSMKLALVGRFADDRVLGDHGSSRVWPPRTVTPADGFRKVFASVRVCSSNDIDRCREAAEGAEAIVIVVGNNYEDEGEFTVKGGGKTVKGGDRRSLRLHDSDVALIESMSKLGKPVCVIFYSGSAVIIEEWKDKVGAVLYAGYPGMEGGNALAALVSGAVAPSGKLPFTVAKREEDYPRFLYDDEKKTETEYGYWHGYAKFEKDGTEPAYPFGYGLTYTEFAYGDAAVRERGEDYLVSVKVRNRGGAAGTETVLVFAGSGIEWKPKKLLKGFCRVALGPGEEKLCEISVPKNDLLLYNNVTDRMELPEKLTFYVGANIEEAGNRKAEPCK